MQKKLTAFSLISAALIATFPASANADPDPGTLVNLIRKVGIHANIGFRRPTDPDVTRGVSFGPSVGLSPGQSNGWKFPIAYSMFREDFHGPQRAVFGSVRTRAVLAGVGYGWHFGRFSVGPQVEVGYAFTNASLRSDASQALELSEAVSMHVENSWIARPEFKAEYFITPKVTFRTSIDYMRMEPNVALRTPAGVMDNRWHMSNVHANIGVGFYPFRK